MSEFEQALRRLVASYESKGVPLAELRDTLKRMVKEFERAIGKR